MEDRRAAEMLKAYYPRWFHTQALVHGVDRYGYAMLPNIVNAKVEITTEMPSYHSSALYKNGLVSSLLFDELTPQIRNLISPKKIKKGWHDQNERFEFTALVVTPEQLCTMSKIENEALHLRCLELKERVKYLEDLLGDRNKTHDFTIIE